MTRAAPGTALLAALLAACGGTRQAGPPQAGALRSTTCPTADSAAVFPADAAIGIVATVRAREVQVREHPRTSVSIRGDSTARPSCDARSGLPRPVRAGETYRDVEVRWRLSVPLDTVGAPADTARPVP